MKTHALPHWSANALSVATGLLVLGSTTVTIAETLSLEEVVVTASFKPQTKMDASVSITTVSEERIAHTVARSTTEIFRSIPGVRSESSSGESNTNISIRGIPVASGGGKFLQLHEDGLPVLQFGDIIVGNADNYLSYDWTVERVEAIKGGTSSTLASNSPAGVINFVSKTGEEEGGSVGMTTGLDYDSQRFDFEFGSPLNDEWSYHAGGYYRAGEGVRETDFDSNKGGQLKVSLKRSFDSGSVRVYVKALNDKTATYLPMPMRADGNSVAGFSALTGSNIPTELLATRTGDGGTGIRNSSIGNGSRVKSLVIGAELNMDVNDSLSLRNRIRLAKNSGNFFGAFTAQIGSASNPSAISNAFMNRGVDGLAYASGPNAGIALNADQLANLNGNGLIQNIRSFDNDINSLDNFNNDLSLTKSFDNTDVTLGYYTASQDIDIDWYWQTYVADVSNDVRLLDAYSGNTQLTQGGLAAFGSPDWGFCCYRDTQLETDLNAIYVAVNSDVNDSLSLSASVRYDRGEGVGHYAVGTNNAVDFDGNGLFSLAENLAQTISQGAIAASQYSYEWDYVSYAAGLNQLLSDSAAIFANISQGGRVNADRLGDGGFIQNGTVADGAIENTVTQYEVGYKHENDDYGIFATAFYVETEDANSEGTSGLSNAAVVREYEASGIELEVVANVGDFSLFGGMTWTDAEIVKSNDVSLIGNTPRRQADLVYSANMVYSQEAYSAGLAMIGTTDSFAQDANGYEIDGYTYFNTFVNYQLAHDLTITLAVNNVTNEIGMTEAEENTPANVNGVDYVRARSIAGRSTSIALKYQF